MKRYLKLLTFCALALLGIGSAEAVVLFDNVALTQDDYDRPTDLAWFAQQFTTGGQAYTLDSVTLSMRMVSSGANNLPILDIYAGTSTNPTTFVATLTPPGSYPTAISPFGTAVFTSSGLSLAAGTTYWAVLHTVNGSTPNYYWSTTNTALYGTGTGPGYSEVKVRSTTAGTAWIAMSSGTPYQMTVNATGSAAPLPAVTNVPTLSEWGMIILSILLALGAVLTLRRRR